MNEIELKNVLAKSIRIVELGIKIGYFRKDDVNRLNGKLLEVLTNGITTNIEENAIYGAYLSGQKKLCYNAKLFKEEKEALIYVLYEMKHALDDNIGEIGFRSLATNENIGMNEGATERFATDIAEEILDTKFPSEYQYSLGVYVKTNLSRYQIEDKINELLCEALGITQKELLIFQNEENGNGFTLLKEIFNKFADFEALKEALDNIYKIQEELFLDENGNLLENGLEPTDEQISKIKELVTICQDQILEYASKANPRVVEKIEKEMIILDEKELEERKKQEEIEKMDNSNVEAMIGDAIFEENIKENTENKNIENTTNATNATTAIVEYKEKENFFIKILTGLRNMLIKVLS